MRTPLEALTDIEKLHHAIDCIANGVPIPGVIADFLIEQGLYELVTKPKVKHGTHKKRNPTRKS